MVFIMYSTHKTHSHLSSFRILYSMFNVWCRCMAHECHFCTLNSVCQLKNNEWWLLPKRKWKKLKDTKSFSENKGKEFQTHESFDDPMFIHFISILLFSFYFSSTKKPNFFLFELIIVHREPFDWSMRHNFFYENE